MIITGFVDNWPDLGQKSQVVKNTDFRSIRHPALNIESNKHKDETVHRFRSIRRYTDIRNRGRDQYKSVVIETPLR